MCVWVRELSVARQRRREVREGEERAASVRQAASPAILSPREAGETWAERYRARVCGGTGRTSGSSQSVFTPERQISTLLVITRRQVIHAIKKAQG